MPRSQKGEMAFYPKKENEVKQTTQQLSCELDYG